MARLLTEDDVRAIDETMGYYLKREDLISRIEGVTGTLESMPYDRISTDDLQKILSGLKGY